VFVWYGATFAISINASCVPKSNLNRTLTFAAFASGRLSGLINCFLRNCEQGLSERLETLERGEGTGWAVFRHAPTLTPKRARLEACARACPVFADAQLRDSSASSFLPVNS
jgi:hypothetical protein